MKKLDLKKAACDVAFATAQQNLVAVEAATAAKGGELQLPDPQFEQFRNDVKAFRSLFRPAFDADQAEAARAKTASANAKPVATPAAGAVKPPVNS